MLIYSIYDFTFQAEEKLAAQKKEELAAAPPKLVPGPFNLPNVEQKGKREKGDLREWI